MAVRESAAASCADPGWLLVALRHPGEQQVHRPSTLGGLDRSR